MDSFPEILKVSSTIRNDIYKAYYDIVIKELRKEIYMSIIKKEMYYSLDSFAHGDHPDIKSIIKIIQNELLQLGWETCLAYGDTALFVYYDNKPVALP